MLYIAKGILCFPHEGAIVPFMTMLKMEDAEVFDILNRQNLHMHQCDHNVTIPVMTFVERQVIGKVAGETTVSRLCNMAAKWGLTFKLYMQNTANDDVREWHCFFPNNDVDKYLKDMGLHHGSAGEGMAASCMRAIVEDTFMEMQVFFGDKAEGIESDTPLSQCVKDFLTKT